LNFFDTIVRLLHTGRPAHFYFTCSPLSLFVLEVWSCDPPKRWAFELSLPDQILFNYNSAWSVRNFIAEVKARGWNHKSSYCEWDYQRVKLVRSESGLGIDVCLAASSWCTVVLARYFDSLCCCSVLALFKKKLNSVRESLFFSNSVIIGYWKWELRRREWEFVIGTVG